MTLFTLHIDSSVEIVRSTDARLRAAMWRHIRQERARGVPLAQIVFCWSPVQVRTL
jgi:hypothetical protein